MKRYTGLIILFVLCVQAAYSQYDPQFSQYFGAMNYYNPARAGSTEYTNITAMYRMQWVGFEDAPQTFFGTADMPFKIGTTKLGVGAVVVSESYGLFQKMDISAQLSYRLKLFGGELSVGLQAGMVSSTFNGDKVKLPENSGSMEDPAIPTTKVDGSTFDIGAGIYYTLKRFYFGFAGLHLTEPEITYGENAATYVGRSLNLTTGYNIPLKNPLFELQPSVFLKTDMYSFQADITGRVLYDERFSGGLSYRINESVVLLLGARFGDFQVGYAYDFPTTAILKASSGSHEFMVNYRLMLNKPKTGKNRHKSVRIL